MKNRKAHKLPPEQRKLLQAMMDRDGLDDTRKTLGISRYAMEKAAAGMNIQAGTVSLITQKLAELSSQ